MKGKCIGGIRVYCVLVQKGVSGCTGVSGSISTRWGIRARWGYQGVLTVYWYRGLSGCAVYREGIRMY